MKLLLTVLPRFATVLTSLSARADNFTTCPNAPESDSIQGLRAWRAVISRGLTMWLLLSALVGGLMTTAHAATVAVTPPTTTTDGSLVISGDITFPVTTGGSIGAVIFDEWVTSDGSNTGLPVSGNLQYTFNGTPGSASNVGVTDNVAFNLNAVTANDGFVSFNAINAGVGNVFVLKSGTYVIPAASTAGQFNPQANQTFAGKVFLSTFGGTRLSGDVQLEATSPTVTTPTSSGITPTSANLGGNVTSDGGGAITERGVVYAPTSANSNPQIGGAGVTKVTASGTRGVFTIPVTGLTSKSGYSFRAYATNNVGTSYSSVATFSTLDAPPILSDVSVSTNEDTAFTFAADSFDQGFSDDNAGDTLQSVRVDSLPQNGTLNFNGTAATAGQIIARADLNKLAFTPAANFNGATSFGFNASDGALFATQGATLTLNIAAVNDAPMNSVPGPQSTSEDVTLIINDGTRWSPSGISVDDPDNTTLTLTLSVEHGAITLSQKTGLSFAAGDGTSDATMTFSGDKSDINAALSGLIYASTLNFNGSDTLTLTSSDGTLSDKDTLAITVTAVNDAPVALDGSATTDEDTAVTIDIKPLVSDVETGDADLTYTIVSAPDATQGSVKAGTVAGTFVFTPASNFNGSSSFTYHVTDTGDPTGTTGNVLSSDTKTITITVKAVNDAPVAASQSVTTDEDVSKTITLAASDVDKDALTYRVVDGPAHGTLTGTAPNLTYVPNADYNGADSFTFVANDGTVDSALATVSIAINPVNDAPVALDRSEAVGRNKATAFTLRATDVDSSNLTYTVVSGPTVGTLSGTAPNLTYTPKAGYSGSDALTFRANDGTLDSNVATITFVVGADNVAPVAFSQKVATDEDKTLSITLNAADTNGDTVTYDVVQAPAHGTLTGTAPDLTYTPDSDFNGADNFTFSANDGTVDGNAATVSINVDAVNDAPSFLVGAAQTVAEASGAQSVANFATGIKAGPPNEAGQGLTFNVSNDNNALFSVQPAIASDGTLTYTLAPKAAGSATVSVTLQDNGGTSAGGVDTSAAQTFAITVTANPILFGVSIAPKAPLTGDTLTATPVILDGAGVTYVYQWFVNGVSVQKGASNTLDLSSPGFGDKGDVVSVTVSATNNRGGAGNATNQVTVRNSAPFAFSGSASAQSGVETLIPFKPFGNPGGADSDGDALTYKRVGGPKNGVATFETDAKGNNVLRYTARRGFVGVEVIRFVAVDELGRTSNVATLGIDVKGQPILPPTAEDASATATAGVQVDVPVTGSDPNGGAVSFKRVGGPKNGVGEFVTLEDGTTVLRYTARSNFVGTEEVRFVALNSDGRPSNVATIRITVSASGAGALQTGNAPSAGNS